MGSIFTGAKPLYSWIYRKLRSYVKIFVNTHKQKLVLVNYYDPQPARFWELFTVGCIREETQTLCLPDS